MNLASYGDDYPNDTVNYGHNPALASNNRNAKYGDHTLQGLKTDVRYFDASASFLINPKSMMNIAMGFRARKRHSGLTDESSRHIYMALRWSIKSHYYDY